MEDMKDPRKSNAALEELLRQLREAQDSVKGQSPIPSTISEKVEERYFPFGKALDESDIAIVEGALLDAMRAEYPGCGFIRNTEEDEQGNTILVVSVMKSRTLAPKERMAAAVNATWGDGSRFSSTSPYMELRKATESGSAVGALFPKKEVP